MCREIPKTKKVNRIGSLWSGKRDSNSRPQPWQGCALPTELFPHILVYVPTTRIELARLSTLAPETSASTIPPRGLVLITFMWSGKRDSNSRPQPWQGCALPTELFPHGDRLFLRKAVRRYALFSLPPKFSMTIFQKSQFYHYFLSDVVNCLSKFLVSAVQFSFYFNCEFPILQHSLILSFTFVNG